MKGCKPKKKLLDLNKSTEEFKCQKAHTITLIYIINIGSVCVQGSGYVKRNMLTFEVLIIAFIKIFESFIECLLTR